MQIPSLQVPVISIGLCLLAQLVSSAPAPASTLVPVIEDPVGPCYIITVKATAAIDSCLKSNLQTCYARVSGCIAKHCGLKSLTASPATEACVQELTSTSPYPESLVVGCVKGYQGGCPGYEFVVDEVI